MKILAGFYAVCTAIDWLMFLGGKASITNSDLLCYDKTILLVNSNLGGLYMLSFGVSVYTYAMFMWFTFYQVPKKFGVVSRRHVDDVGAMVAPGCDTSIYLDEENLKTVVRELDYDRRFTRKQTMHSRKDSECSLQQQ